MFTYTFSLPLDVKDLTDELADKIYEAGCDDALLSKWGDNVMLTFERESLSLDAAMKSAEADVSKAGIKVLWIDLPTGS